MSQVKLSVPADIQERVSQWAEAQRKPAIQTRVQARPTLTLSRQFGCEGFPLAERIQELLEGSSRETWTIFDRALIDRVTEDEGICRQVLEDVDEKAQSLEAFGFHPSGQVASDLPFARVAQLITQVARRGNAIVVGRGGAILCRGFDNAFHFRLEASFDWRVASLAQRLGISQAQAVALVESQSRLRDEFIFNTLGRDLADPLTFDAIFNNERHSVDVIAKAIVAFVKAEWKGEGLG